MIRFGMHTSLWTANWSREAAELAIPEAARYGLDVLEIALLAPETVDVAHSRALLEAHGIKPAASLCLPFEVTAPLHPEAAERFLMRALDAAHALGCDFLGGVTYSTLGWRSGLPPTEAEYDNIVAALKPVARRAADLGVTIGLEPCNRYETHLLNTAAQGRALIARIGEPNLTIHLDTYHMNIEEKGLANGFRTAGKATSYVHLSESDRGVPGTGTVDWRAAFAALKEIEFSGYLVMESFVTLPPEIAAALSVWRPVARDRYEVLDRGVPFLKGLAREYGLVA
jgi:D-psicose/D-tagatose/L-ribulose 3-epimerase